MLLEQDNDTIAAVSTAPGTGGIAVIRCSGPQSLSVVRRLAPFLPKAIETHRIYFGTLLTPGDLRPVDEVLISYFQEGKSFTGEEVVEISCHGSEYLAHQILNLVLGLGLRHAVRGEFTYRAFMNGRIDLLQAEATLSLIESNSKFSASAALRQLKGSASLELKRSLDLITDVGAHLEANIDYAQEDIVVASPERLVQRLNEAEGLIHGLLEYSDQSRILQEGFHIVLVGLPNVGKSSLLNCFLNEERAIVSPVAGTTRDYIDGHLKISGVEIKITDTAGLRSSSDVVESLGIERSRSVALSADLILFIIDEQNIQLSLNELSGLPVDLIEKTWIIRNKSDDGRVVESLERQRIQDALSAQKHINSSLQRLKLEHFFLVSARTGEGVSKVLSKINDMMTSVIVEDSPMVIRARHQELMKKCLGFIDRAKTLILEGSSPEFSAFEIKEAVILLHELLGQRFDDQIMDRVFSDFCLGK